MGETIRDGGPGPRAENSPCTYNTPKLTCWKPGQPFILQSGWAQGRWPLCFTPCQLGQIGYGWRTPPPLPCQGTSFPGWRAVLAICWEPGCGCTEGLHSSPRGPLLGAVGFLRAQLLVSKSLCSIIQKLEAASLLKPGPRNSQCHWIRFVTEWQTTIKLAA